MFPQRRTYYHHTINHSPNYHHNIGSGPAHYHNIGSDPVLVIIQDQNHLQHRTNYFGFPSDNLEQFETQRKHFLEQREDNYDIMNHYKNRVNACQFELELLNNDKSSMKNARLVSIRRDIEHFNRMVEFHQQQYQDFVIKENEIQKIIETLKMLFNGLSINEQRNIMYTLNILVCAKINEHNLRTSVMTKTFNYFDLDSNAKDDILKEITKHNKNTKKYFFL